MQDLLIAKGASDTAMVSYHSVCRRSYIPAMSLYRGLPYAHNHLNGSSTVRNQTHIIGIG